MPKFITVKVGRTRKQILQHRLAWQLFLCNCIISHLNSLTLSDFLKQKIYVILQDHMDMIRKQLHNIK